MSFSPILDYHPPAMPSAGEPLPPEPPVSEKRITPLINGQSYIDVLFGSRKVDNDWEFIELQILNTTDPDPLNIWPGILTDKTVDGFQLQLNGMPDSNNYYLHWMVVGVSIEPSPATSYLFSGPSSTPYGTPATFTVALAPSTTVEESVTVTPSDGGAGGTFVPTSVSLSNSSASATFVYTPVSYGVKTISVTNSGTLLNPASIALNVVAPTYTLTGPSSGEVSMASTNFTVTLSGPVIGTVTVTPSDASGGTFTPTTVNLTTGAPSATFVYTPASVGTKTISVTNSAGLINPASLTYTATATAPHLLANLISYWKLDETGTVTRNDSKGSNHLATGNLPGSTTGKINLAAQFQAAVPHYLSIPSNTSLQVTSDFTWSLWVKLTTIPPYSVILGKTVPGAGNMDYLIQHAAGYGFVFQVNDNATVAVSVGTDAALGVWYHVVAWWDSADQKLRLRINDATTYVSTMTSPLVQTANALYFGTGDSGAGLADYLNGVLDEVGFWKRKLNASEITALYNGGAGLPLTSFTP
jgi:hypothetical protein